MPDESRGQSIFDLIGPIRHTFVTHPLFCHSEPGEESPKLKSIKTQSRFLARLPMNSYRTSFNSDFGAAAPVGSAHRADRGPLGQRALPANRSLARPRKPRSGLLKVSE
jgi:hypothetical protein